MRSRAPERLRRSGDFREIREKGRRIDGGAFLLWHMPRAGGADDSVRIGYVASRAVGSAVWRNRAKRRMREILRQHAGELPGGVDLIVSARASIHKLPHAELERRLMSVIGRVPPRAHGA